MAELRKRWTRLLRRWIAPAPVRELRRTVLWLEVLESRWCPAGTWAWNGPLNVDSLWSNPGGNNWLLNGAPAGANNYPGKAAGDGVVFSNVRTGPCTLDVELSQLKNNPLNSC
jgi:hypothetical protein